MAIEKKRKITPQKPKAELLWRKPITLDVEEETDPLATLYRGREVSEVNSTNEKPVQPIENKDLMAADPIIEKEDVPVKKEIAKKASETVSKNAVIDLTDNLAELSNRKVLDSDLKNIFRIKSETFNFTDIREILRGKSIEIYAYLLLLSADRGNCKIKHLDLMKVLDISRPTLFKQGEWLTKLSLIEKSSVPGDHFGTSYNVYRLENTLPIADSLIEQFNAYFEEFRQTIEQT